MIAVPGRLGAGRRRRPHRRRREDHLQLLEALLDVPADVNVHTSNPAVDLLYALYFHLASPTYSQDSSTTVVRRNGDEQRVPPDEFDRASARSSSPLPTSPSPSRRSSRSSTPSRSTSRTASRTYRRRRAGRPSRSTSSASSSPRRSRSARASRRASPTFPPRSPNDAAAAVARRADGAPARRHGDAPVGGLEEAADHRHAALPSQRRAPPLRRLAQQHVRAARPRRDQRARPRDRRRGGMRNFLPSCSRSRRARRSSRA